MKTWKPEPLKGIVTKTTPTNSAALRRENETLRRMVSDRDLTVGELRGQLEIYRGDSRWAEQSESVTL